MVGEEAGFGPQGKRFHVEAGIGRLPREVVVAGLDWRVGDEGVALQYANEILIQKEFFPIFFNLFHFFCVTLFFIPKKYARYANNRKRRRAVMT